MNFYCLRLAEALILHLGIAMAVLIFTGCTSTPDIKLHLPTQSEQPVINYALSLQGTPYRFGKASPEEGFDCSGFVMHVYGKYGVSLPRSATEMASALPPVTQDDLRSGDLVFFNTNGRAFSHVGIFINDDKFIHAPSQRTGHVLVSSLNNTYWRKHFTGIRRPRT
jgi:cell wall-associated NlpC family hydrolase